MHVTSMRLFGAARPPVTMPCGRICTQAGCETRLSIYNPEDFCALHADTADDLVPAGFCRCGKCGRVLEWTPQFFHRDSTSRRSGLHTVCKECRNGANQHYVARRARPREMKRCPHCGQARPLTLRWWYRQKQGVEVGRWSSWCKPCHRERHREEARAERAEKRARTR